MNLPKIPKNILNSIKILGRFLEGEVKLEEALGELLPLIATVKITYKKPLLGVLGVPNDLEFDINFSKTQSGGKEWLAILLRAKEK